MPAEHYDYSVIETVKALERRYASDPTASTPTGSTVGQRPSAIRYNWNWYGRQSQIRRQSGLVQERFITLPHMEL